MSDDGVSAARQGRLPALATALAATFVLAGGFAAFSNDLRVLWYVHEIQAKSGKERSSEIERALQSPSRPDGSDTRWRRALDEVLDRSNPMGPKGASP